MGLTHAFTKCPQRETRKNPPVRLGLNNPDEAPSDESIQEVGG
jgi:hypothetical protein